MRNIVCAAQLPGKVTTITTLTLISPAEYLAQEAVADHKSDYHAGVIVPMPGAQLPHDRMKGAVGFLLPSVLPSGYELFTSDVQVAIPATHHYVYPDLTVVAGEPDLDPDSTVAVLRNPLLIVEVLSETTQNYDRGTKFAGYRTLPTFREYILIAQERISITQGYRVTPGCGRQLNTPAWRKHSTW